MFVSHMTHSWSSAEVTRPLVVDSAPEKQALERQAAERQAPGRATIAQLSADRIQRFSRVELARVVRASGIPVRSGRLEYLDRATLERLAHLAKLSCCHRR
ncbi:MAG: hypothetical protein ACODAD_13075 [Planctomycetota bacterium]